MRPGQDVVDVDALRVDAEGLQGVALGGQVLGIAFAVEDIDAVVAGLRARGAELVGELERYENSYRLCYVRGPEGIISELAEEIG
jgi:catechol 2,3-dioxygenase-like lactoylglutathione lyase family enzyme